MQLECSRTPVPIPRELALTLAAAVEKFGGESVVTDEAGRLSSLWELQRAVRVALCNKVKGLPEDFRYHDLRHYFASLLIASGLDVKVVQTRLRHASAMTTSTPMATCGRTRTSPHEQPSPLFWLPVRTHQGLRSLLTDVCAGQGPVRLRCRSTSRTREGAGGTGSGPPR